MSSRHLARIIALEQRRLERQATTTPAEDLDLNLLPDYEMERLIDLANRVEADPDDVTARAEWEEVNHEIEANFRAGKYAWYRPGMWPPKRPFALIIKHILEDVGAGRGVRWNGQMPLSVEQHKRVTDVVYRYVANTRDPVLAAEWSAMCGRLEGELRDSGVLV